MNNKAKIKVNDFYQYSLYKSRNTQWYFNDLIKNGFTGYNSVKFKNDEDVYVWLDNVTIEQNNYLGELSESGALHKISIDEVIDWLIINDGRLIGGYTIRHYRNTLDDEAKINFDIDLGVKIDDGDDFFKPDFSTPEGVIILLEKFYTEEDVEGILTCRDFSMEAQNILKEKGLAVTIELKKEMSELLKISFVEDLKTNGFPYFTDIERSFSIIEEQVNQKLIQEKVIYEDGGVTYNTLWVGYSNEEWKVLNLVE